MAKPNNPNSVGRKSDKEWRDAIRKAVHEQRTVDVDGKPAKRKALFLLARKTVDEALDGNMVAVREIGDRLDGRPAQAVDVAVAVSVERIERLIVDPAPVIEHEPQPVVALGARTTRAAIGESTPKPSDIPIGG
jgi:uncharacterized membrane protein